MNFIYEAPYPIKTKLLICFAIVLIMSFAVSVISVTQRVETVNAAVDLNRKLTGNFTVLVNTMEKTEVFNAQLFTYLDSGYTNTELRKTLESSLNEIAEYVDKLNVNDPDTGVYMHTVKGNGISILSLLNRVFSHYLMLASTRMLCTTIFMMLCHCLRAWVLSTVRLLSHASNKLMKPQ